MASLPSRVACQPLMQHPAVPAGVATRSACGPLPSHKVVEQEGDEECIHRPHNEVRDSPGRVFNFSCILGQHIHYEAYIVLGEDIVTKMSNFLIE